MVGIPKHLNSRQDYDYLRANFDRAVWEPRYRDLLDGVQQWFNIVELRDGETGIEDTTHKITTNDMDNKRYQYELRDDPNCLLARMGFTVDEVTAILGGA